VNKYFIFIVLVWAVIPAHSEETIYETYLECSGKWRCVDTCYGSVSPGATPAHCRTQSYGSTVPEAPNYNIEATVDGINGVMVLEYQSYVPDKATFEAVSRQCLDTKVIGKSDSVFFDGDRNRDCRKCNDVWENGKFKRKKCGPMNPPESPKEKPKVRKFHYTCWVECFDYPKQGFMHKFIREYDPKIESNRDVLSDLKKQCYALIGAHPLYEFEDVDDLCSKNLW
jgi:hypothetical protein